MKEEKTTANAVETVETVEVGTTNLPTTLASIETLIGKEADEVTKALLHRPDCNNHPNLIVTNITANATREGNLTVVCNKPLPQYMLDSTTGGYTEGVTRNVFTTTIQLAAILKSQGEMLLAKAIMDGNLNVIMAILKGSRISVISRYMAAGEEFCNPYTSRISNEKTVSEHDRFQFYMYDIVLADKAVIMQELQLAKMLG